MILYKYLIYNSFNIKFNINMTDLRLLIEWLFLFKK